VIGISHYSQKIRDTTSAGRVIGLEIADNAVRNELLSSVAPVVLDGTMIRYG